MAPRDAVGMIAPQRRAVAVRSAPGSGRAGRCRRTCRGRAPTAGLTHHAVAVTVPHELRFYRLSISPAEFLGDEEGGRGVSRSAAVSVNIHAGADIHPTRDERRLRRRPARSSRATADSVACSVSGPGPELPAGQRTGRTNSYRGEGRSGPRFSPLSNRSPEPSRWRSSR